MIMMIMIMMIMIIIITIMIMMIMMILGDDPLVSTVSGHPQFLALWVDTPIIFNHVIVNYIRKCVLLLSK